MQCDALIRSLYKHVSGQWTLTILHHNDEEHKKSYDELEQTYEDFKWVPQWDFNQQVVFELAQSELQNNNLMFLTDDCIFFDGINLDKCVKKLNYNTWCVSLRLGLNTTTQCYWTGQKQPDLLYEEDGDFIRWNWARYNYLSTNWAYPSSLDATIYKASRILNNLPPNFNPQKPRDLEGQLLDINFVSWINREYPQFAAPRHSKCVCLSINAVQDGAPPNGLNYHYNIDDLNRMFLDGYRVDINRMDFTNICGCHDEREFFFKKIGVQSGLEEGATI